MVQQAVRKILTLFALISPTITFAQSATTVAPVEIHGRNSSWQVAQAIGLSIHKLVVITLDQPDKRQFCRVRSFTPEKLVCSRAIGGPRTYMPQLILALIVPGDAGFRLPIWLGLNAGLGASIWATVALAAPCPVCAAATGIAALFFFGFAGATVFADDVPDKLLYIASGKALSGKFHYSENWP